MPTGRPLQPEHEIVEAFRQNGQVSEYLASVLPDAVWRQSPAGGGRTIAAIFAHMQSVRRMFARTGGLSPGPPSLDKRTVTQTQASRALRQSTEDLAGLFEAAFRARRARVTGMPRRTINMISYLMQHDAHHRGQICTLARQLGHEFSRGDIMKMWGWKAITRPRRRHKSLI